MEKFEVNKLINDYVKRFDNLFNVVKPEQLKSRINELEEVALENDFWTDQNKAKAILKETTTLKNKYNSYLSLENKINDFKNLMELDDDEYYLLMEEDVCSFEDVLSNFEVEQLLNEKFDDSDCVIEIHPGAGGTESQDWASMLYRMYIRYFERHNYEYELLEYEIAEEAGVKSCSILVKAPYAYGYLKGEKGVHRLIRISPFDSNARRHTSFVAINVYPMMDGGSIDDFVIPQEDLRIDTYRASGAGGQHINKTDSAIRITHLPTNIVATCQNERSQIQNRERAMEILKSKVFLFYEEQKMKEVNDISKNVTDNAFGNQIRTYTLQPYTLVKDHRTNIENGNAQAVLDGDIDLFINGYLQSKKSEE